MDLISFSRVRGTPNIVSCEIPGLSNKNPII